MEVVNVRSSETFNGESAEAAGGTVTDTGVHEKGGSVDGPPRVASRGDGRQAPSNDDEHRVDTGSLDLTTYHVVEEVALVERQQQQQHKQQNLQQKQQQQQQQQQHKQVKHQHQGKQDKQQQQHQQQQQQQQHQQQQLQHQENQQNQQQEQEHKQQHLQQEQQQQKKQQQQHQQGHQSQQLKQEQNHDQLNEEKEEQQQLQQTQLDFQKKQEKQKLEQEEKQNELQDEQLQKKEQSEQLQDEQHHEKTPEEQQHEQLQHEQQQQHEQQEEEQKQLEGEQQHEQLQREQQHEQFVGEQQYNKELEDDKEEEELLRQRLQRRQHLFELQQQLQQLRELQQLHQQTRSVDASVASPRDAAGEDETEDEQTLCTDDTSTVTRQMTKPVTNRFVHHEATPTANVCDDDLDYTREHRRNITKHIEQLKRDPLKEHLSSTEERDIGLPLLHRINEALSEAAEILSHSMSPSVFVEEINKETSNDHTLVDAGSYGDGSGTCAISKASRPTHDTCKSSVSEVLSGMEVSTDNGNSSIVTHPDRVRNTNLDPAPSSGDSLIVSPGAASRVNRNPEVLQRVCAAGTTQEQGQVGIYPEHECGAEGDSALARKRHKPDATDDHTRTDDSSVRQKQLIIKDITTLPVASRDIISNMDSDVGQVTADDLVLPDMSKLKLMNLVLKLRREMAAMQQQMSSLQDNMRAFNSALDLIIEHVCDNL